VELLKKQENEFHQQCQLEEKRKAQQKEIQKKEYNLTLKELEEKVNKNLNTSNLSSKTNENQDLIKNKVMAKTLSL
jgi:hypothetical protein